MTPSSRMDELEATLALRPRRTELTPRAAIRPPAWQRRFSRQVVIGDLSMVLGTGAATVLIGRTDEPAADRALIVSGLVAVSLLLLAMAVFRAWDRRAAGQAAPPDFARLARATGGAIVVLALAGLALRIESVRLWVFVALPVAGLLCLLSRALLRLWLVRRRRVGLSLVPVLAVGDEAAVRDLICRTRRDFPSGWQVTAACTPTGRGTDGEHDILGVPVIGDLDSVIDRTLVGRHRIVAVCPAAGWGPARLQRLSWQLEETDAELVVDPGLMEVAGPRMHVTPVDGLPFLRLSRPRFTGPSRVLKGFLDRVGAGVLLVVASPVLITVAVAVRLGDGGPVLFRQERVGSGGRSFRMIKFRTMCVDAENRLQLLSGSNDGAGPLFKLRADPRVTRVGRVLRRYSLDELPQLLNVLSGSMSLVGPRPPLPSEVARYADNARRRLLVRPGMTGLWQVSGRSTLSWEETVRLDLRYVENWSLTLDLVLLWRTLGAVVRGRGAY